MTDTPDWKRDRPTTLPGNPPDPREETPERVWILRDVRGGVHVFDERGDAPEETRDDVPYIREDMAYARVTAALREAAELPLAYEPCAAPDAILALIPESGGALDRAIAEAVQAEREACAKVAERMAKARAIAVQEAVQIVLDDVGYTYDQLTADTHLRLDAICARTQKAPARS